MPPQIETVTGELIAHWVDITTFSRYVVLKMEMDDNDADDINEAQDEAAAAGETRGNKRRRGTAIRKLMRDIDNFAERYGVANEG